MAEPGSVRIVVKNIGGVAERSFAHSESTDVQAQGWASPPQGDARPRPVDAA